MFTMTKSMKSKVVLKQLEDAYEIANLLWFATKCMKGIGIILLFVVTAGYFDTVSAQSPTQQEIFDYQLYLCSFGGRIDDDSISRYARETTSRANEFTYEEEVERNKTVLKKRLKSVSFAKRFSEVFESKLGKYSFSDHGFPLEKITAHLKLTGTWIYIVHPDEVVNINQFKWFVPMSEAAGKAFVEGNVERKVLLRITYSIMDYGATCKSSDTWFSSFFHSIEVFDATTRNPITTFKADTTPDQAKKDAPTKLRELLATLPELKTYLTNADASHLKLKIKSYDSSTDTVLAEFNEFQNVGRGQLGPLTYTGQLTGNVSGNMLELTGSWVDRTGSMWDEEGKHVVRVKLVYDGAARKLVGISYWHIDSKLKNEKWWSFPF